MVSGKIITGIVVSILVILGVYFFISVENVQQSGNSVKIIGTGSSVMQNEKIVEIFDDTFSPSSVTIEVGDKVTFDNKGGVSHWPISEAFNPGHELVPGENWGFVFYEKGTFEYSDNLNANLKGTIIVE